MLDKKFIEPVGLFKTETDPTLYFVVFKGEPEDLRQPEIEELEKDELERGDGVDCKIKSEPIDMTDSNGVTTSEDEEKDRFDTDLHQISSKYPARLTPTHRASRDSIDYKLNGNSCLMDQPSPTPVRRSSSTLNASLNTSKVAFESKLAAETASPSKSQISGFITNKFKLLVALVAVLVFVLGNNFYFGKRVHLDTTQTDSQENTTMLSQNLRAYIKELRNKYPNQSSSFWANIESSCKHSLIKQRDPSIVLIVNDLETKHLARTIITDVLNTLLKLINKTSSNKLDSFVIDPVDDSSLSQLIKENSYDKSKLYIDTKLINLFKAGDRLALVNHIEVLPAQTMLLFYTYGDDLQNAKFPGILILMSLNIDTRLDDSHRARFAKSSSSLTKYAEDYLFNLWSSSIDDDQLRPLFTRIANNVIFVNNE